MKVLIFTLLIGIVFFPSQTFCQNAGATKSLQNGQSIYATFCMSCHMENGEGLQGTFPPLNKTGHLGDKNKLVKIIIQGQKDSIKVKGVTYATEMVGISLTDQELTDVINYIRNSWGNKYPFLKVSDISESKKRLQ